MPTTGEIYGEAHTRAGSNAYANRLGGSHSKLPLLLYPYMWEDTIFVLDDFMQDTLNLDFWTLAADSGTGISTFAISTGLGGRLTGTTGTDDENFHSIKGPLNYFGDNNCGMEIRFQQNVVVNNLIEMGFVDALTDDTLAAINDIDTPSITNGAVNVAVVAKDYSQSLKTLAFITDGDTSNFNTTKTNLGTRDQTADTYMTARVGIAGNAGYCAIYGANGELVEFASHGASTAASTEGGTVAQPWFISGTKVVTNDVTTLVDYISCWEDRYTRPS